MPSVYLKTYGCQMNERDSEAVAAQLVAKGYTLAPSESAADVILLNTCSVRDLAEQKALNKMVNLVAETRRDRPGVVLGFMGCMAQSRGQELIDRLPDVDLVLGTQKFHRVAECLDDILAGRVEKIVDVAEELGSEATIREHLLYGNGEKNGDGHRAASPVTAFVSIMQGCNQYCTFCIVPYTRGEERSRTIPDIVSECRQLVAQGVKEITLLGQIVTSYGRRGSREPRVESRGPNNLPPSTFDPRPSTSPFVQLLDAVHEIEGLERIRFTSPHPKGYGDDLIEAYARLPKLVESAHLPVQSGSNRVLKLMHTVTPANGTSASLKNCAQPNRKSASAPTSSSVFRVKPGLTLRKHSRSRAKLNLIRRSSSNIRSDATRRPRQCRTRCHKMYARNATSDCWKSSTKSPNASSGNWSVGKCKFWWKDRAKRTPRG